MKKAEDYDEKKDLQSKKKIVIELGIFTAENALKVP